MFDNPGLAAVFFGIIPALMWGVADFFVARGAQRFGAMKAALVVNGLAAVIFTAIYLLFLQNGDWNTEGLIYALVGSVSFGLAQTAFFKAMELGPVSLGSSIGSTYPLVALVMGLLFFGAAVTGMQVVGIVLIVFGVMVASGLLQLKKSELKVGRGPVFALGAALGWGVGLGFISHAMTLMSWQNVIWIEMLIAPVVLLAVTPLLKGNESFKPADFKPLLRSPFMWVAAVTQMTGLVALNLGLAFYGGFAPVIIAISSCYPALTTFLALRHLKEKVPLVPLIGGATGVIGVVVLALGA